MREHNLQPKRRRRYVATTDSDHDSPIFRNLARDRAVDDPNQLWVADLTYIVIAGGFVYLAAIALGASRPLRGLLAAFSVSASADEVRERTRRPVLPESDRLLRRPRQSPTAE
jgi:putative transposase